MTSTINDRHYWDGRFAEDWDSCGGPQQSEFFARVAIQLLPQWFRDRLAAKNLTICDWGCAEGSGTAVLQRELRPGQITGIDFSTVAIERASATHPNIAFSAVDLTVENIDSRFDVIFTSNTLEHFKDPWTAVVALARYATKYIVALVPFQERNRFDEHEYTFEYNNIRRSVAGEFALLSAREIDLSKLDHTYWPGKQVLLIYAKLPEIDALSTEGVLHNDLLSDIASYRAIDQRQDIEDKQREIVALQARTTELERATEASSIEIAQKEQAIDRLSEELTFLRQTSQPAPVLQTPASTATPRKPERSLLRRAYGRLYRTGGAALRQVLPTKTILSIREWLPHPEGIPKRLAERVPQVEFDELEFREVAPHTEAEDIFVLSIINWDFRYQRPQHLASGLAGRHRVFFVEMDLHDKGFLVRQVQPNLYVIRIPREGIGHLAAYVGRPTKSQIRRWLEHVYRFCDRISATSRKHIVIEHPFWWQLAAHLPPDFQITVDCMDDIAGFSNTEPFLLELEHDMLSSCDNLVVSSKYLYDKYDRLHPASIIRNGGDIQHFARGEMRRTKPAFMPDRVDASNIRVGYVGAIAEWFDIDLVEAVATLDPSIEFHLCGAVTNQLALRLSELPNVTLHGEISYVDVPAFLEQIDVAIIPFQLLPIIQACDPVKFYEYSAMGIPTVSTRLPELSRAEDLVLFADTSVEFAEKIRVAHAKRHDAVFTGKLIAFAEQNQWRRRAEDFEIVLSTAPVISVVILAFGDASLTDAALISLHEAGGRYPALEVIVVDNGSPDRELERVRASCARYANVRLLENGTNLGFARGNNVGISASTGEYILLLNNDVYVPPGAIEGMLRHLQRNPQIGAVGPLTNNIGNEARLDIAYSDMREMTAAARAATTGYRGQWTPLPALAYFAVMFRRDDLTEKFGLLSEEYGTGMFEDDDHCRTIRSMGFVCALAEDCFIHHHLSASFNTAMTANEKTKLFEKNRKIFEQRWGEPWQEHRYRDIRPPSRLSA